jgi:prefoldin subunit 5
MENTQKLQEIQTELHSVVKSIQQLTESVGNIVTAKVSLLFSNQQKGPKRFKYLVFYGISVID